MIRPALAADLDAIMDIERRLYPTDAWSAEMMTAEIASPHGRYFVDVEAEPGGPGGQGRVVGYAGVRALSGSADSDIQTIALDAAYRGSGRGRALLHALLTEAAQRGAREAFLEVRADNPVAEGLYASEGFVVIGRRPGYYQPDNVDALSMKLDLRGWMRAQESRTDALLQDNPGGSVLQNDNRPVKWGGSDA